MKEIIRWISKNVDKWYKICRVKDHEFDESELIEVFAEILNLCADDMLFNTILMVFLTEYRVELPFFEEDE